MKKINENLNRKYKYAVSFEAERQSSGFIELTKKQAELIAYATNTNNWENAEKEPYSGMFFIDIDNPIELTSEIKKYLLSDVRYKDFAFIDEGAALIELLENDLLENKEIDGNELLIQVHLIEPIREKEGNVTGITGFAGQCKFKDGKVFPLDGDTYNSEMTVYGYNWFTYSSPDMGSGRGLDVLVGSDW